MDTAARAAWRSPKLLALGVLVVAAAAAAAGLLLGQGGDAGVAAADAATVAVSSHLPGGATRLGTGIVLSPGGEVLTVDHLISGSTSISVTVPERGTAYPAAVVGADPTDDIAVLQLHGASGLSTIATDDLTTVAAGDHVTALGAPGTGGSGPTTLQGSVTAVDQIVTTVGPGGLSPNTMSGMIQFDPAIRSNDCGGPLLDAAGRVVAMDAEDVSRVRTISATPQNDSFAIPIGLAVAISRDIETGATTPNVLHGDSVVLGVAVLDSSSPAGALVLNVAANSPAQAAGIRAGDVIVAVGGSSVTSTATLHAALLRYHAGQSVTVRWLAPNGAHGHAEVILASGTA